MQQPVEAPTPVALADLVARCAQIDRYSTQLTAAEETRIAALAAALLEMRNVLDLPSIKSEKLPMRQRRISHWQLGAPHLADLATPAVRKLHGMLALDEHEQIKVLSSRNWRGAWREVKIWRDGVCDLSSHDLMTYLAALSAKAQERAPDVARALLERSKALAAATEVTGRESRQRDRSVPREVQVANTLQPRPRP